jgi:hypothetical protein
MQVQVLRCTEIVKKHVISRLPDGTVTSQDVDCSPEEEAEKLAFWQHNIDNPPPALEYVNLQELLAEINQLKARLNAANIPNPPGPPATPPGQSQAQKKAK